MIVLLCIAILSFFICVIFFFASFFATLGHEKRDHYKKGEATFLGEVKRRGRDEDLHFEIAYTVDGVAYKVSVHRANVEAITYTTRVGSKVSICYDPEKPERVIISDDPTMRKTMESWKRTRKRCFIGMLISLAILVLTFPKYVEKTGLPRNVTTIGQFRPEFSALSDKQPDKLIFTESIGSPDTFHITIDDPTEAKKVLDMILNAQVSKVGSQVDMAQYRYETYCFVFGKETITFGFLPHSYFCYNGQDYELGENRISAVCDSLHERAAEAAQWYGDDAELLTMFVDNGDEARSVTELFLNTGDACLTGYIEGAYEVLSIEKQPDGYVVRYTYGDFYSHDAIRSSRITVENGEMVITDCGS